ncbi:YheC/YheD family protein [uncultured Metabacillus sp.]|uniref:YheC/YheD family endospore coat-associated protein n=1 Tax=uncultured Metabacillus sp. TaxID=2860135 RepID=UPI002630EE18|nr:YheC/YheD family protein [uncultured Metabacillus sp.]
MSTTYTIQITSSKDDRIHLPSATMKYGQINQLSFGSRSVPCKVLYKEGLENQIVLPIEIATDLMLPDKGKIHLFFKDGNLHLGSLVGVFTAGFTKSAHRPLGERSLFFAKYLSMDQSVGVFSFVFGSNHINWEEGTINGFTYDTDGWKQVLFPFPNAVYDRLPNRRVENHQVFKIVKKRFTEDYSIPWYNPGFFNKWMIHKLLIHDTAAAKYLPATYHPPTISRMEEMLASYQSIYLKPANSSLGNGVYQLMYSREDNQYYCRYRDEKQTNRLRKYPSIEHFLKVTFKDELSHYIAQQGIKLLRIDGKPVDFRVHTNKNEEGIWKVTAIAAKIAGKGSVTTHLNNGGVVKTLEEIYKDEQERKIALRNLTDASIILSKSIDDKVQGFVGEIGFDLGIDQNGSVWMFEANSKPGRSIFCHPDLKEADILSRKASLEYGLFLSKKAIYNPEELMYEER